MTATQGDNADGELDIDALVLGENVSPSLSDADAAYSSDDDSGND